MYVRLRYMFECNWMFRSVKSRSLEFSLAALPQVVALDRQMNDCKDDLSQVRRTVKEDHKTHLHNLEIAMWDSYCAFSHRICLAHMWELQLGPELQIVDWMLIVCMFANNALVDFCDPVQWLESSWSSHYLKFDRLWPVSGFVENYQAAS